MSQGLQLVPKWATAAFVLGLSFSFLVFMGVSIDPVDYLILAGKKVSDSLSPSTSWAFDVAGIVYGIYGIAAAAIFILTYLNKGIFTGVAALMFFFAGFIAAPYIQAGVIMFLLAIIPAFIGRHYDDGYQ